MRFDLDMQPEDIVLRFENGEQIAIKHTLMTAKERSQALELLDTSLSAAFEFLFSKFIAWVGVDDANGSPIPLERMFGGKKVSNIDRVLGMVPWPLQVEVLVQQLIMNGVSVDKLLLMFARVFTEDQMESVREIAGRLGKPLAPADGASSAS